MSNICTALSDRGHEVIVLCLHPHHSSFEQFPDKQEFLDKVTVNILDHSEQYSFSFRNRLLTDKLCAAISAFRPDIIHSHLFESEIAGRTCFYPDARWFSHCHDNMPQFAPFSLSAIFSKSEWVRFIEKRYLFRRYRLNGGTHFIAISNHTLQYYRDHSHGYPVSYLVNAIRFNKFHVDRIPAVDPGCVRLINVGSFSDKKNQALLLQVALLLRQSGIPFKLTLVGDGRNRASLEQRSHEMGISDAVCFTGNVSDVENYLAAADIYVHSATYEPLGLVLLEAMAAGLPVVSLDGKGNRDIIKEGLNGFMITKEDPGQFVAKISALWSDKELYGRVSSFASKYAQEYDISAYIDRLLALYKR